MVCVIWQVQFGISSNREKYWNCTCICVINEYVFFPENLKISFFFTVQHAAFAACDAFTAGPSF